MTHAAERNQARRGHLISPFSDESSGSFGRYPGDIEVVAVGILARSSKLKVNNLTKVLTKGIQRYRQSLRKSARIEMALAASGESVPPLASRGHRR